MIEYAVMAEMKSGGVHTLRRGFPSKEAAEDYPVVAAHWKRVWVEPIKSCAEPLRTAPPLPWEVRWHPTGNGGAFTYLHDADGHRIASLWGAYERREHIEKILQDAGLIALAGPASDEGEA